MTKEEKKQSCGREVMSSGSEERLFSDAGRDFYHLWALPSQALDGLTNVKQLLTDCRLWHAGRERRDRRSLARSYGHDQTLRALNSYTCRKILDQLRQGPQPVKELGADRKFLSRASTSQTLKLLLDAGLVTRRREGRLHFYEIRPAGFKELAAYLRRFAGASGAPSLCSSPPH